MCAQLADGHIIYYLKKTGNSCLLVIGSFIDSIDIFFYQSAEHFAVSRMVRMRGLLEMAIWGQAFYRFSAVFLNS